MLRGGLPKASLYNRLRTRVEHDPRVRSARRPIDAAVDWLANLSGLSYSTGNIHSAQSQLGITSLLPPDPIERARQPLQMAVINKSESSAPVSEPELNHLATSPKVEPPKATSSPTARVPWAAKFLAQKIYWAKATIAVIGSGAVGVVVGTSNFILCRIPYDSPLSLGLSERAALWAIHIEAAFLGVCLGAVLALFMRTSIYSKAEGLVVRGFKAVWGWIKETVRLEKALLEAKDELAAKAVRVAACEQLLAGKYEAGLITLTREVFGKLKQMIVSAKDEKIKFADLPKYIEENFDPIFVEPLVSAVEAAFRGRDVKDYDAMIPHVGLAIAHKLYHLFSKQANLLAEDALEAFLPDRDTFALSQDEEPASLERIGNGFELLDIIYDSSQSNPIKYAALECLRKSITFDRAAMWMRLGEAKDGRAQLVDRCRMLEKVLRGAINIPTDAVKASVSALQNQIELPTIADLPRYIREKMDAMCAEPLAEAVQEVFLTGNVNDAAILDKVRFAIANKLYELSESNPLARIALKEFLPEAADFPCGDETPVLLTNEWRGIALLDAIYNPNKSNATKVAALDILLSSLDSDRALLLQQLIEARDRITSSSSDAEELQKLEEKVGLLENLIFGWINTDEVSAPFSNLRRFINDSCTDDKVTPDPSAINGLPQYIQDNFGENFYGGIFTRLLLDVVNDAIGTPPSVTDMNVIRLAIATVLYRMSDRNRLAAIAFEAFLPVQPDELGLPERAAVEENFSSGNDGEDLLRSLYASTADSNARLNALDNLRDLIAWDRGHMINGWRQAERERRKLEEKVWQLESGQPGGGSSSSADPAAEITAQLAIMDDPAAGDLEIILAGLEIFRVWLDCHDRGEAWPRNDQRQRVFDNLIGLLQKEEVERTSFTDEQIYRIRGFLDNIKDNQQRQIRDTLLLKFVVF